MTDNFESIWIEKLESAATRQEAARRIFESFAVQLHDLIQANLADYMASRVEPDDILQSTFNSFFNRTFKIENSRALYALLAEICLNKTREKVRFHQRQRRDVRREQSLDENRKNNAQQARPVTARRPSAAAATLADEATEEDASHGDSLAGNPGTSEDIADTETLIRMAAGATPEQAAIVVELLESLPAKLRQIIIWRVEGLTADEIATELGCTRRTVVRRVDAIRRTLETYCREVE